MRGRKPTEKKIEFQLTGVEHIRQKTQTPKPDAKTQRSYIQPKASFSGGRYVLRTKKFVQLETQREIKDVIQRVVIIQNESSLQAYLHFKDGTIQQL